MLESDQRRRLLELLRIPTAPFREQRVRAWAEACLDDWRIPHFRDPHGNLLVGVASRGDYRQLLAARSREPVRLYIAHMDHPGFHGVRWLDDTRLAVRWLGGSPTRYLSGAAVWLCDAEGERIPGRLYRPVTHPQGYGITAAEVRVHRRDRARLPRAASRVFGGWAFRAPAWRSGRRIHACAVDDLAGVFAILETARTQFASRRRPPFIGLLTRAEEVGFVGAIAHLQLGWWRAARQRPLVCVSLEASRTLPGAEIGKGPVVRLGDRRSLFDPGGMHLLSQLAEQELPGRHQRRIMDGGSCEATATTAFGLRTLGLTVPLGNYHNEGYEGGPDCRRPRGPAPEFVHEGDVAGMLALCEALMAPRLPWHDPWRTLRERLIGNRERHARLLLTD
ncbi:hypothetical protein [Thiohalobacter sp.]|uniref:hypothetical protein n=1 Tax=Thiohalobacter sp. TaxID=2025948 RepID=UPI00262102FB|nr:hypothetical protein [Thiohalobacter sp.]